MTPSAHISKAGTAYCITVLLDGQFIESTVYEFIPLRVAKARASQRVKKLTNRILGEWQTSTDNNGNSIWVSEAI